jgi:riboflavin synthase
VRLGVRGKMFTGIVEEVGEVVSMREQGDLLLWDGTHGAGFVLTVRCAVSLEGCFLGASIAVNGTCLTATAFDARQVSFGIAPETLRKTNLALLKPGDKVNMERAAKMGDRNSGHYVQGHVDGTGRIVSKTRENESLWIKVAVAPELLQYIVKKGFVAVDGTSLTVCEVNTHEGWFTFMLVQWTQTKVIIPLKAVGDLLNIEMDVMGKFAAEATRGISDRVAALESTQERRFRLLSGLVALQLVALVALYAAGRQ